VGTIGSFHEECIDQARKVPKLDLYDASWPILSSNPNVPGAKINDYEEEEYPDYWEHCGGSHQMVLAGSCVVDEPVHCKVVTAARNVRFGRWFEGKDTFIMSDVWIGERVKIQNAIVMQGATLHVGTEIGFDLELDANRRGLHVDKDSGIVIVERGAEIFPFKSDQGTILEL
jgi:glucose-1-phosphate adenylyltransferase